MKYSLLLVLMCAACTTGNSRDRESDTRTIHESLRDISPKTDPRAEVRKEVPATVAKANDELSEYLNMMHEGNENPQVVRDKFNYMISKKRSDFRGKVAKLRSDFRDDESARRKKVLDAQKFRRDQYQRHKHDAADSREFYAAQDKDRLAFTADEKSRRANFESELTAQTKDFDSDMSARQKEFDEQYRLYAKKSSEKPKDSKAATGEDFKQLNEKPAIPLGNDN